VSERRRTDRHDPDRTDSQDHQGGRACFLCGMVYGERRRIWRTIRGGIWACTDQEACVARRLRLDGFLADWPCLEEGERVRCRPMTGLSWREWHLQQYELTGDPAELERAERHPRRDDHDQEELVHAVVDAPGAVVPGDPGSQ
jgi:hypothetical protein